MKGPLPLLLIAFAMLPMFGCVVALHNGAVAFGFACACTTAGFCNAGAENTPVKTATAAARLQTILNPLRFPCMSFIEIPFCTGRIYLVIGEFTLKFHCRQYRISCMPGNYTMFWGHSRRCYT